MRRLALTAVLLLAGCSATPVAQPTRSPVASSASPASASPTPARARFDPGAVVRTATVLATRFPRREATTARYARAAAYVRARFGSRARLQRFAVKAGMVDRIAVPAGMTANVIDEPAGYDPHAPHLVVGAHLDTVPDSPGANDDGSGVALVLELQRLTRLRPPRLPVVFVAFGAEERRRQSPRASQYASGSRAYLDALPASERRAIKEALVLDMVAVGSRVHVLGQGGRLRSLTLSRARALGIDAFFDSSRYFSDNVSFEAAGIPAVWFYSGDDPALHTPRDTPSRLQRAEVDRVGRLAWDVIQDPEA